MNLEEMTLQLLCSVSRGDPSLVGAYTIEKCFNAVLRIKELVKEHESKKQPGPPRMQPGEAIS